MKFPQNLPTLQEKTNCDFKGNQASSSSSRLIPMGDCVVNGKINCCNRSNDPVSCWGDVPKRPTRFIDILEESEREMADSVTNKSVRPHAEQRLVSSAGSERTVASTKAKDTNSKSSDKNDSKVDGTRGRERLLEWLKSSQAKRDENNRQVFTRWIDKLESMNQQTVNTPNLNPTGISMIDVGNTNDYQQPALYTFPSAMPGPLNGSAFWINSPMGMVAQTPIQTNFPNMKLPTISPPLHAYSPFVPNALYTNPVQLQNFPDHSTDLADNSRKSDNMQATTTEFQTNGQENVQDETLSLKCLRTSSDVIPCWGENAKRCLDDPTSIACDQTKIDDVSNNVTDMRNNAKFNLDNRWSTSMASHYPEEPFVGCGGYYPQPIGITTPTTGDPSSPQMLCYCYIPNPGQYQLAYAFQPQVVGKIPPITQPMIYYYQQNGTYPKFYPSDGSLFGQPSQVGLEQTKQQDDAVMCQTMNLLRQTNESQQNPICNPDELNGANIVTKPVNQDDQVGLQNKSHTVIDFDFQKWYSILSDITQSSVLTK